MTRGNILVFALLSTATLASIVSAAHPEINYQVHSQNDLRNWPQTLAKGARWLKIDPHFMPPAFCQYQPRYNIYPEGCFPLTHDTPTPLRDDYNTTDDLLRMIADPALRRFFGKEQADEPVYIALCFKYEQYKVGTPCDGSDFATNWTKGVDRSGRCSRLFFFFSSPPFCCCFVPHSVHHTPSPSTQDFRRGQQSGAGKQPQRSIHPRPAGDPEVRSLFLHFGLVARWPPLHAFFTTHMHARTRTARPPASTGRECLISKWRPWISTWIVGRDPDAAGDSDDPTRGFDRFAINNMPAGPAEDPARYLVYMRDAMFPGTKEGRHGVKKTIRKGHPTGGKE